jgi:hypothetical protein
MEASTDRPLRELSPEQWDHLWEIAKRDSDVPPASSR